MKLNKNKLNEYNILLTIYNIVIAIMKKIIMNYKMDSRQPRKKLIHQKNPDGQNQV